MSAAEGIGGETHMEVRGREGVLLYDGSGWAVWRPNGIDARVRFWVDEDSNGRPAITKVDVEARGGVPPELLGRIPFAWA